MRDDLARALRDRYGSGRWAGNGAWSTEMSLYEADAITDAAFGISFDAPWMSLAEAAKELNVASSTLRWQIRNGKLRAKKFGSFWTVTEREVERYARENRRQTS